MAIRLDLDARIKQQQVDDLFTLANAKAVLPGTPYRALSSVSYPTWNPTLVSNIGDVVLYNGKPFLCTANGNTNPPGSLNGWSGLNNRGAWSAGTYNLLDQVTYGGYTFICLGTTTLAPLNGSGNLNNGWTQMWLSAFARLRANLLTIVSDYGNKRVSGPWPVTSTNSTSYGSYTGVNGITTAGADAVDFYYASATGNATVNLLYDGIFTCNDSALGGTSQLTAHFQLRIGGSAVEPAVFDGVLTINPIIGSVSTAQCTTNFPGAVFSVVSGALKATVNAQVVPPGVYDFYCLMTGTPGFYASTVLSGATNGVGNRAALTRAVQAASVEVSGIHNSKKVWKKPCPKPETAAGYPFGYYSWLQDTGHAPYPYYWKPGALGCIYTASQAGIWAGKTEAIKTLGLDVHDSMPWNLLKLPSGAIPAGTASPPQNLPLPYKTTGSSPSIAYSKAYSIWEKENTPPPWVAQAWYPVGFKIQDSNGNIQVVTVAGKSGAAAPTWPTTIGSTVDDGTAPNKITWQTAEIPDKSIIAGRARMFSLPAYPIIWDSDVWVANKAVALGEKIRDANGEIRICSQAGTTGGSQPSWGSGGSASIVTPNWGMEGSATEITDGTAKWRPWLAGFNPVGWWVYRININKITPAASIMVSAGSTGAGAGAGTPGGGGASFAMVTIGCYRSGAFVAFGTYPTDVTFSAMWPIFTNTPLVYQCSERVDVQASVITTGLGPQTGGVIGFPLCAAHYDDLESLLNII